MKWIKAKRLSCRDRVMLSMNEDNRTLAQHSAFSTAQWDSVKRGILDDGGSRVKAILAMGITHKPLVDEEFFIYGS